MAKKKKKLTKEEQNVIDAGIDMEQVNLAELKAAVKELNESELLDASIKVAKRTAASLALSFCKAVEKLDDDGLIDDIPEAAFEYYGKIVPVDDEEEEDGEEEEEAVEDDEAEEEEDGEEEEEEDEEEEEPEPAKKKKTAKAKAKAKPKTKEKAKEKPAKKKAKGPGVIATILDYIADKGPVSRKQILAQLVRKFPDRDAEKMEKTVACQIGGKKRPLRMEREKNVTLAIDDKGKYAISAKKKKKKKK